MKAILFLLFIFFKSQILYAQSVCYNIPPVAIAGNDTIIHNNQTSCITPLPITITLNGSSSFDPDGILVSYLWTGQNGINSPNASITTVTGIVPGTYTFILKVTDNNGAFAYDTINISIIPGNRPLIPARLISIGTLSTSRPWGIAIAAAGGKILFAGGQSPAPQGCGMAIVEIYDTATGSWVTAQLSEARLNAGVAVLGNKIFFGGGIVPEPFGNGCGIWNFMRDRSSVVDIYDASSNAWSTAQLARARCSIGATADNKVFFAGGEATFPVFNNHAFDTYDNGNNSWSDTLLSGTGPLRAPVTVGNTIYYAGGVNDGVIGNAWDVWGSKRIDIYDAVSGIWSVDSLASERAEVGAIYANNKIYWAGGFEWDPVINDYSASKVVEIRDLPTNTTSFDCLSQPRADISVCRKDNKLFFFNGDYYIWGLNNFDIYDLVSNSWSIGILPQNIIGRVISYGNNIYLTDGTQAWKMDIDNCTTGSSATITASACDAYSLNGKTYRASGLFTQKLINATGCDSLITLNLTVNYSTHCTTTATACDSFTWQGKTYTTSGFYSDTLASSNGCDSILSLALTINNKILTNVNAAICSGQIYEGHTTTGTYIDTLIAANGCDSIRTLNLTVKPRSFSTIDTAICAGQNYAGHTTAGTYTDIFIAANGCDSIRTLNLTIKNNCNIYIPNAFTPNKNGLNDLFKPTINLAFNKFSFIIFNRYGQKIFETYEYGKGWDGTYKGKAQLTGSYVYRITFTNISGWVSENNGTVLLLR
jgi:gliding motility-associated-like protein